jgi:hypothetical protein
LEVRGKNLVQKARFEYLAEVGLNPDDLGQWGIKWRNLKINAKGRGRDCEITFEQYIGLAIQAGIRSPDQIGTAINKFHMCRKGDVGDYILGNCEFKPHSQNSIEKMMNGGNAKRTLKVSKGFRLISPQEEIHEGLNLRQFCRDNDLSNGIMSQVCRGLKPSHKGWKGVYLNA